MTFGSQLKPVLMPIYIYAPIVPMGLDSVSKPENWKPVVYPSVQFIVTNQQCAQ